MRSAACVLPSLKGCLHERILCCQVVTGILAGQSELFEVELLPLLTTGRLRQRVELCYLDRGQVHGLGDLVIDRNHQDELVPHLPLIQILVCWLLLVPRPCCLQDICGTAEHLCTQPCVGALFVPMGTHECEKKAFDGKFGSFRIHGSLCCWSNATLAPGSLDVNARSFPICVVKLLCYGTKKETIFKKTQRYLFGP